METIKVITHKRALEYGKLIQQTDCPNLDPVNIANDWNEGFKKALELVIEINGFAQLNFEFQEKVKSLLKDTDWL